MVAPPHPGGGLTPPPTQPRPLGPPTRASEIPLPPTGQVPPGAVPHGAAQHGAQSAPARTMALDSAAALAILAQQQQPAEVVIGRDPTLAQVVLDQPVVSGRHAKIGRLPGGALFVEDLGSTKST
jgi:hypothetical protein